MRLASSRHLGERVSVAAVATTLLLTALPEGAALGQEARPSSLEEVVVTAQKREENLQDVPISINALSAEQLGSAQVSSVADLANISPSINLQGGAGFVGNLNFSMRGVGAFATDNGIQPAIGIVVDEIPLSRQAEFDADMSDVSSIQMLSGPQGTLFGTSTTAGVLVIQTQQPTATFQGYVEGTVTDDSEYQVRASLSGPLSERARARVSVYHKDRDDFIENLYPGASDWGGEEAWGANLKLDMDVADSVRLWMSADYRKVDSFQFAQGETETQPPDPALLPALGNGDAELGRRVLTDPTLVNTDIDGTQTVESRGVAVKLTWDLSDRWTLLSISGYREYDLEVFGLIDLDGTPATFQSNSGLPQIAVQGTSLALNGLGAPEVVNSLDYFTQELRFQYQSEAVETTLGGFYISHDELFIAEVPLIISPDSLYDQPRGTDTTLRSWAVFGDATWHITDVVSVFAGARWTSEELSNDYLRHTYFVPGSQWVEANNHAIVDPGVSPIATVEYSARTEEEEWSGRAGASFKITPDHNIYISASRGFTGSSVDSSPRATLATAFVDPSIATSYEIGAKSTLLDNRLRMNVALFTMKIDDLQISGALPGTLDLVTYNAGSLESQGIELSLTALLGERLRLDAGVALLDSKLGELLQQCYAGQSAAQGCIDLDGDGFPEQNVKGKPGLVAPDLKYNVRASYDLPFSSLPFDGRVTLAYTWQDETYTEPNYDPVHELIDSYGLLDVSLGIADRDGRYDVSLFGKNVLDERFATNRQSGFQSGVDLMSIYSRGSFAYWGIKARWNF